MILRIEDKENTEERVERYCVKTTFSLLCSLFFVLFSISFYAQDSIPAAKDLTEEKELDFQQYFFKALSEKSIGNYQQAIQSLESCNQILPERVVVYFEFSKNHLLLNNKLLAKEYIQRALTKQPKNIWMLKHLVKVYLKNNDFINAIATQEGVVEINPKERAYLVRLYLQNRDYKKGFALMNTLEEEDVLPASLKRIKSNLEKRKGTALNEKKSNDLSSLENQFKTDKSYKILKKILEKSKDSSTVLLKYSEQGIALFPAQPYVYFMKGKALNYQKKYKKALTTLKNGIDFVIEDAMEANFYKEMAISYKGLGNFKEEKKYKEKSRKLKS